MTQTDVLVIGAGASGLAAAYELSLVDKKIIVVEARNRIGGRIHSVKDDHFLQIVETGAEFIHGKLPVTLGLLEKAGIKYHSAGGKMWEVENGQIKKSKDFVVGWDKLMKELKQLEKDEPIKTFLNEHFPGEDNRELRDSVIHFVEGYDAADASRASSFALRDEWENEDDNHQERIDHGYMELMNFFANEIKKRGNEICLSKIVRHVNWQNGRAEVVTADETFIAAKVLVTIPLGLWQAEDQEGCISFFPSLQEKIEAAKQMGFGAVIKINMQFQNHFWEDETSNKIKDAGFIFSDGEIPTWWTQHPIKNGMLTGWIAGPKAMALKDAREEEIFRKAILTLSYVFGVTESFIENKLVAYLITNWTADPFARGAYSYATLETEWAKDQLGKQVEQTLYFAGEALYKGSETGTVEGAIANGIEVAREIIIHS